MLESDFDTGFATDIPQDPPEIHCASGSTLASGKYPTADGRPEAKARCRFSTDLIGRIDIRSTDQTGHIRKENKGFRISGSSGSMAEKGADGS